MAELQPTSADSSCQAAMLISLLSSLGNTLLIKDIRTILRVLTGVKLVSIATRRGLKMTEMILEDNTDHKQPNKGIVISTSPTS